MTTEDNIVTVSREVLTEKISAFISNTLITYPGLVAANVNSDVIELWIAADNTEINILGTALVGVVPRRYIDMNVYQWLLVCVMKGFKVKAYCAERERFADLILELCVPTISPYELAHAPQGDFISVQLQKTAFKCSPDGQFTIWFNIPQLAHLQYQSKDDFIAGKKPLQEITVVDENANPADYGMWKRKRTFAEKELDRITATHKRYLQQPSLKSLQDKEFFTKFAKNSSLSEEALAKILKAIETQVPLPYQPDLRKISRQDRIPRSLEEVSTPPHYWEGEDDE